MRDQVLQAIDTLWEVGAKQMVGAVRPGVEWVALVPLFVELEQVAYAARLELESAADSGEAEPLRQARVVFRMIEAAASVCVYTWAGGDRGYSEDTQPWAALGGQTIAMLPELRRAVAALPPD